MCTERPRQLTASVGLRQPSASIRGSSARGASGAGRAVASQPHARTVSSTLTGRSRCSQNQWPERLPVRVGSSSWCSHPRMNAESATPPRSCSTRRLAASGCTTVGTTVGRSGQAASLGRANAHASVLRTRSAEASVDRSDAKERVGLPSHRGRTISCTFAMPRVRRRSDRSILAAAVAAPAKFAARVKAAMRTK